MLTQHTYQKNNEESVKKKWNGTIMNPTAPYNQHRPRRTNTLNYSRNTFTLDNTYQKIKSCHLWKSFSLFPQSVFSFLETTRCLSTTEKWKEVTKLPIRQWITSCQLCSFKKNKKTCKLLSASNFSIVPEPNCSETSARKNSTFLPGDESLQSVACRRRGPSGLCHREAKR